MNGATLLQWNDLSARWVDWMVDMSWQVSVLVAALTGLTFLLRRRSATFLYTLWLLVLVRLVLPPAFACPTGWAWWMPAETALEKSPALHAPTAQVSAALDSGTVIASWGLLLMIGWTGTVAALLGMLAWGYWRVRTWTRQALPLTDPGVLKLFDECRRRQRIRRNVVLKNSENCSTPLVVGWFRPVILLPSPVLEQLDERELEAVLMHELNHLRRGDMLVNLLQGCLTALYFFHPLLWWANHQIRRLREEACDELTVQSLHGKRKAYASALLKVTETLGYTAPAMALGAMEWKSSAARRLRRMLDQGEPLLAESRWCRLPAICLVGALLLPAGSPPQIPRDLIVQRETSLRVPVAPPLPEAAAPDQSASATSVAPAVSAAESQVANSTPAHAPSSVPDQATQAGPQREMPGRSEAEFVLPSPQATDAPLSVQLLRWLDDSSANPADTSPPPESTGWRPERIYEY